MASVLITGMTAPQCSPRLLQRSTSFAAAVKTAFEDAGVSVELRQPSVELDRKYLESFDKIAIGISPVLSLSSNYAYGALSVLSLALDVDPGKVLLFVDSPDPAAVRSNVLAVGRSPSSLFKTFHSARRDYAKVKEDRKISTRIESAISFLSDQWNVPTLYPSFPFLSDADATALLDYVSPRSLVGFQCDAMYVGSAAGREQGTESEIWCAETDKTQWFYQTKASLKRDYVLMKAHKGSDDRDVDSVIRSSLGAIISPTKNGHLWWSYRYAQAISNSVPIVTEWRQSSVLGPSWSIIGPSLEEMPSAQRINVAEEQRNAYLSAIEDRQTVVKSLVERTGLDSYDNSSI